LKSHVFPDRFQVNNMASKDADDILRILPKFNCGACGFGSCEGMAKEAAKDSGALKGCLSLDEQVRREFLSKRGRAGKS